MKINYQYRVIHVRFVGTHKEYDKRPLTMRMARALHVNLGIPADVLLQQPGRDLTSALGEIDWQKFPLTAMSKLGWIAKRPGLRNHAEAIMSDLIRRAGGEHVLPAVLYRYNDQARANAKTDPYALRAWCWEVLARANATPPSSLGVTELAQQLGIHPAIVAGRVRHETGNYRLLSHFVGIGEIRRQLAKVQTA